MQKLICLFSLLFFIISWQPVNAASRNDSYLCAKYAKISLNYKRKKAYDIGISRIYNKAVEIYALGTGNPIRAYYGNHYLSSTRIVRRRSIKCKGKIVGQTRIYDLSAFDEKSGIFKVSCLKKSSQTYVDTSD